MSCSLVTELSRFPIHKERVGVWIWVAPPSEDLGDTARPWLAGAARYGDARLLDTSPLGKCTDAPARDLSERMIPPGVRVPELMPMDAISLPYGDG